ncbi:DNA-binding protein BIN4 [Acorus calamus]|uniref:DNA-binding protein BIN4 n=1 Tax=Acorus calamus TaxID=4465 RepID=A0AAV9F8W5_ACOCL|nr:DNA-binding protein BIN4 [Acorus calamus]
MIACGERQTPEPVPVHGDDNDPAVIKSTRDGVEEEDEIIEEGNGFDVEAGAEEVLVECDGDSIDLSGDVGVVGRENRKYNEMEGLKFFGSYQITKCNANYEEFFIVKLWDSRDHYLVPAAEHKETTLEKLLLWNTMEYNN